jgi:predicted Kef-type K+ transport protein
MLSLREIGGECCETIKRTGYLSGSSIPGFAMVREDRDTLLGALEGRIKVRPGFQELANYCLHQGLRLVIVSNGLDFYIRAVLKELDKLQTEAAKAIIGAAVIDDVLALLALAISTDIVTGTFSYLGIVITTIKALVFIAIGVVIGVLIVSKFLLRLDKTAFVRKYPEFIFIFAMMSMGIYGVFLAGFSSNNKYSFIGGLRAPAR